MRHDVSSRLADGVPPRPLVFGHRGAPGYLPEHTLPSFELAIAQGADGVEVDVVASADGVPVIRHERELGGTTDVAARPEFAARRREGVVDGVARDGWFAEDFRWSELQTLRGRERLPGIRPRSAAHDGEAGLLRLADVARLAVASDVTLVVELKEARRSAELGLPLPELVLAELAEVPPGLRIVVESFEKSPLLALADAGVRWPLVYLLDENGAAADERGDGGRTYAAELAHPGGLGPFSGVSLPTSLIEESRVDRFHDAGLSVWAWTLRPENRYLDAAFRRGTEPGDLGDWRRAWVRLLHTGLDAVFADHPDLAIRARHAALAPPARGG
ncbi:MAG: glycerophosphoryl diester phosphodiesterase [Microbacteriaceae bacterium]|nr:glycerophosphoryl diester phosphodiesterase [Microbacteriaceae bacterium]